MTWNAGKKNKLTAIVNLGKSSVGLGTDITDLDTRQGLVVLQRTNRDNESMSSIVLVINNQTSLDKRMGRNNTQTTDPPPICVGF